MDLIFIAKKGECDLENYGSIVNGTAVLRTNDPLNPISFLDLGIKASSGVSGGYGSCPRYWMAWNDELHGVLSLNSPNRLSTLVNYSLIIVVDSRARVDRLALSIIRKCLSIRILAFFLCILFKYFSETS